MADEEDPWGAGDDDAKPEDTPAPAAATAAAAAPAASGDAPIAAGGEQAAPVEGGEAVEGAPPPPPPEDDGYRKPVQLYRHWVRPKYLQYKYIYNYRTNYYDDVIDYLDKKQRGVNREIPRAQTWAERVLRSNAGIRYNWYFDVPIEVAIDSKYWNPQCSKNYDEPKTYDSYKTRNVDEHHLIQVLAASIKAHNYHTKSYINRKYSSVL